MQPLSSLKVLENILLKQKEHNEVTPKLLGKATGSLDGWIVGQQL
jgi:hypothetical protein